MLSKDGVQVILQLLVERWRGFPTLRRRWRAGSALALSGLEPAKDRTAPRRPRRGLLEPKCLSAVGTLDFSADRL
eukprot:2934124-Alexandrium_andersonii.AAC.1